MGTPEWGSQHPTPTLGFPAWLILVGVRVQGHRNDDSRVLSPLSPPHSAGLSPPPPGGQHSPPPATRESLTKVRQVLTGDDHHLTRLGVPDKLVSRRQGAPQAGWESGSHALVQRWGTQT
jgi:hypothetical protein